MTTKRKPKTEPKIPEVCVAIRRLRKTLNLTQEAFAAQLGTGVMSLSRWERGRFQPRDRDVLTSLRAVAADAGLDAEAKLFEEHAGPRPSWPEGVEDKSIDHQIISAGHGALVVRLGSISEWREFHEYRIARVYLPEVGNAMHDDAAPAREWLNTIIAEEAPEDGKLDNEFYNHLSLRLDVLAARKAYPHKFPKEGKK